MASLTLDSTEKGPLTPSNGGESGPLITKRYASVPCPVCPCQDLSADISACVMCRGRGYLRIVPHEPEHEEEQYLNLIRTILSRGSFRMDRTKVGTYAIFGPKMRFDLGAGFPLLTTKRVSWRAVATELLWFVSGSTDAKILSDQKVNIWNGHSSRAYLDSSGHTDYKEGDIGPGYGFQWRHSGAEYKGAHADYKGKGVDQLQNAIDLIRDNPSCRRIIINSWNPSDIPKMALPPCHVLCQFFVADKTLSCQLYQRSCDMGLGVPFNIASYALLTVMIAHITGLGLGEFIHSMGDAHIYSNHRDALNEQIKRKPMPFPTLKVVEDASTPIKTIDDFTLDHFKLSEYVSHKTIKMKMAV